MAEVNRAGGRDDSPPSARTAVREAVRERYAKAARSFELASTSGCGCSTDHSCGCSSSESSCCGSTEVWGETLYDDRSRGLAPEPAFRASLGCGNPTAVADLHDGDVVLDLGSGAGLDALLSARRVGPRGKVYGLDMTDEMLARALENQARARVTNAEFLKGYIEDIPLPAESVDVVISNCVINLSADKERVFAETFRVLRPGGRLGVTDVVSDLATEDRSGRGGVFDAEAWSGCIAGALTRDEYRRGLLGAGFVDVELIDSHAVGDGYVSAIIRARKPNQEP